VDTHGAHRRRLRSIPRVTHPTLRVVSEVEAPQSLPFGPGWPEFIGHDPIAERLLPIVRKAFVDWSLVLMTTEGEVAAGGWGVPIHWDGSLEDLPDGWDGALERSVADLGERRSVDTLCAMATEVVGAWQGQRLSGRVLAALRERGQRQGLARMVAPTRPTLKARYPLTPIERYMRWERDDGSPFDPWVRVHWSLGAHVLAAAPRSMEITGSVGDWERWAGMSFPETGTYVVPEALDVLRVDRERNVATYVEPAIWVEHPRHAHRVPSGSSEGSTR
jgi:hypothetical protein